MSLQSDPSVLKLDGERVEENEEREDEKVGHQEEEEEEEEVKSESSDEDDANDDELTSEQESGSEAVSASSHLISCDDTNSLEVKFREMTRQRLKHADFTAEAASWKASYSKPLIHVSLITEDETGNVSIENHHVYGDKEVTCEIQGSTDALRPSLASTSASTSCDESSEIDDRDIEDELHDTVNENPSIFKLTRNVSKEPLMKMARRRGVIRNISESDEEEEQYNHVMSLLGAHMEPQKSDVEKCGHFLKVMSLEADGHTDTEQMSDDD